jgi:regulatory protein
VARRHRETIAEARARRGAVDDPAVVLEAAARFLEVRPRSVAEVRRRLRDAGYRPELVEGAVERMVTLGYLDDAAFARTWVESRDRARPRGARALRDELRRKGVAPADIEAALAVREATAAGTGDEDLSTGPEDGARAVSRISDEDAAARLLARRGGAVLRERDPRKRRAKAYALLARNGFDPDVCGRVAAAWLAEGEPDPDP